ncbi:siderophore-interacting protein [uncultured Cohaesibacter sp.]|uniref:siderophore-interacting protein n=1 Tax=uncultured Cohaesibacter sp. TaxID=1002546 RepID=UPI0029C8CD54|nr:siderophore-interacting protein [uncultured Cohaesibacter sp.]
MSNYVIRQRYESARRRTLVVSEIKRLTPHMLRIELEGDMEDFASGAPDDHIKLFFEGSGPKPDMRDYTPRAFDVPAGRLTVDFAIHEAGPATDWAINAKVGDTLDVGGPRGSAVINPVFDWWLLIGDETALPAIGRRVEESKAGTKLIVVAAIPSEDDKQSFETEADLTCHWVTRPLEKAAEVAPMLDALKDIKLPQGKGFIWIAAEASVAKALRDYVLTTYNHPLECLKASGYWTKGLADKPQKSLA